MDIQTIGQRLGLYIELEKTRIRLHQEKVLVCNQQFAIGKSLTDRVPDDFIFRHDGQLYRILMDDEDGGIKEMGKIKDFETWKVGRPDTDEEDLG